MMIYNKIYSMKLKWQKFMLKIYVLIFKKTLILKTIILTYVCKHTHSHTHTYHTYIHIFMYIYTHTHTHTYRSHIYTHMHVYIYTYRSHILHTCMCVYINMYIYTCTSIYICVCVGVCGCVCVYIHTYIYTPSTPRCRWCRPPAPLAGDPHPRATTAASSAQGELAKKFKRNSGQSVPERRQRHHKREASWQKKKLHSQSPCPFAI